MKTAVEWYNEQLNLYGDMAFNKEISLGQYHIKKQELLEQAKEKERQFIVTAIDSVEIVNRFYYQNGEFDEELLGKEVPNSEFNTYFGLSKNGEQYYNETFKQEQ
jgi:hypothetical protein